MLTQFQLMHFLWIFIYPFITFFSLSSIEGALREDSSKRCSRQKILICGVCKNVEPFLFNTIKSIEKLGKKFDDYAVIIYENNSTDQTKYILKRWKQNNKAVTLISEDLTEQELKADTYAVTCKGEPFRAEIIAKARNRVLEILKKEQYKDFKYVIMADLDFKGKWPLAEIINSIENPQAEWDCISANGTSKNGVYYDRYAFRDSSYPLGPELLDEAWWQEVYGQPLRFKDKQWIPVFSAFGGLAIYKRSSLLAGTYLGRVDELLKLDYYQLLQQLSLDNSHVKHYLSFSGQQDCLLPDIKINFCNNSGCFQYPACCEHVILHAHMRLKGKGKIFINPQLIMLYD